MPPERTETAPRPLVVHLLPDLQRDDPARGLVDLTRHLCAHGFDVLVVSAGGPLQRELVRAGARHQMLRGGGGMLGAWLAVRRLASLAGAPAGAVLHVHDRDLVTLGGKAARRAGAALLTTIHRAEELQGRDGALMLAGDRAVAVSEHVAELALAMPGSEPGRVVVVPQGVDLGEFDATAVRGRRVAGLADRWNIPADRKVILVPAPLEPGHGHLTVLRAAPLLRRHDLVLMFLGTARGNGLLGAMEAAIRAGGIGDLVRFVDGESDLAAALQLAHLVALPAERPLAAARAVVAAQAMGKPVVVSNLGALPELMLPASTGWIVPPESPAELAWALDLALAMDEEARGRLAERARSFVAAELSGEAGWRRMARIYRELLPGD